ncbi:hypothetical protein JCM6882_001430 [Rhodosporidiobolus microsporus]
MPSTKTAIPVTLGLMTWGTEGAEMARVHDVKECEKMLDIFLSHGHNEVDSALIYGHGSSEEYLGKIDWKSRNVVVDTKLAPGNYDGRDVKFTLDSIRKWMDVQLKAIGTDSLDMWYLHMPDTTTPLTETLEAVNTLYKEGKFKRFGVSNYSAWQVTAMFHIADKNGWVKPTAYQGIYNALHRSVEPELFPVLRAYGLSFYAYNPLCGGFFTGQVKRDESVEKGSRFDAGTKQGANYRARYLNDQYYQALDLVQPVAEKHGLTLPEIAFRWVSHHSLLAADKRDNILIGASSIKHLEANLADLEKGELPEEVVKVLDEAWEIVKPVAMQYFRGASPIF